MHMTVHSEHPLAGPFAYWIAGYQNFYEPIVRAWFADQGQQCLEGRSVIGKDLLPSIQRIDLGTHGFTVQPERLAWARDELARKAANKQGRVQLDLLVQMPPGLATGECKSWGGYAPTATWKIVEEIFIDKPDGLFLYLSEIRGQPVVESVLVLWRRSGEHELIEQRLSALFGRPVRALYLDEILRSQTLCVLLAIEDRLRLLDDAVRRVRAMLSN
jgi:hypothetical protein